MGRSGGLFHFPEEVRRTAQTAEYLELERLEELDAEQVLTWAIERFHPSLALSVAGGAEGMTVLDMALRIEPGLRAFTLDTGKLHRETLEYFETVEEHFGIEIERHRPDPGQLERMESAFGTELMFKGINFRALCCEVRKLHPMKKALKGLDAYITGLRRTQAATRVSGRSWLVMRFQTVMVPLLLPEAMVSPLEEKASAVV